MDLNPTILALIPARSESKRLPGKNLIPLAGKPLIAYTIEAAKESGVCDRIVVSTDAEDIAVVAIGYGAEAPFLRPKKLAQDSSSSEESMLHSIKWLMEHESYESDYVMLLQPTSPMRTSYDIRETAELAVEKNADSIVSVCQSCKKTAETNTVDGNGLIHPLFAAVTVTPNKIFHFNGAIYMVRTSVFLKEFTLYPRNRTFAYEMPPQRSIDIDNLWELAMAEFMLKNPSWPEQTLNRKIRSRPQPSAKELQWNKHL